MNRKKFEKNFIRKIVRNNVIVNNYKQNCRGQGRIIWFLFIRKILNFILLFLQA